MYVLKSLVSSKQAANMKGKAVLRPHKESHEQSRSWPKEGRGTNLHRVTKMNHGTKKDCVTETGRGTKLDNGTKIVWGTDINHDSKIVNMTKIYRWPTLSGGTTMMTRLKLIVGIKLKRRTKTVSLDWEIKPTA